MGCFWEVAAAKSRGTYFATYLCGAFTIVICYFCCWKYLCMFDICSRIPQKIKVIHYLKVRNLHNYLAMLQITSQC